MPLDNNIKYRHSSRKKPLILVTNDDGYQAEGINALAKALKKIGDVLVVAPLSEQSATSHSLTLRKPLRCREIAKDFYAIDGSPTDCVNLAVNFFLKGHRPDILFSGINHGFNLGDDIHYSGTVSAAVEGGIFGVPSVAVSTCGTAAIFEPAADFAVKIAKLILKERIPSGIILNVNVPGVQKKKIKGYKITFQGKKNYSNITNEKIESEGDKYYWICGDDSGFDDIPGSDCNAIGSDFISISPIRVNITEHDFLKEMRSWRIK